MEKTLYTSCCKKDIAPFVIFSGDPGRVEKVAARLQGAREVGNNREFVTYTGTYGDTPVTVTSTGIGGPSAAIALEEMAEGGMKVALRIGTVMGMGKTSLGELLIPVGSMRMEATSKTYVPESYPAVADPCVINAMGKAARRLEMPYSHDLICSMDGFYSQMKESRLSRALELDIPGEIDRLERYNISGLDMESGVVLTLSRLLGIKGGVVTLTTVLKNLEDKLETGERLRMEEKMIEVVLEGIRILDEEGFHERV